MSDLSAFLDRMMGQPYDPNGLHCWQLVRLCQEEVFGRTLPAVLAHPGSKRELIKMMAKRDQNADWCEIREAQHGAVVFLTRNGHGPSRAACHSGVWLDIDGGGILHTDDPHGVTFESMIELQLRNWADISFYVPVSALPRT
jgi:hypothetical protein